MTREDLRPRLRDLALGETAMLTRSQFAEAIRRFSRRVRILRMAGTADSQVGMTP